MPLVAVGAVAAAAFLRATDAPVCDDIPDVPRCVHIAAPAERPAAPVEAAPLLGGGQQSLEALRGQLVVVNFWAPWCAPCRVEQPELNDAHEQLADDGVTFLGVALQSTEANVAAHWDEYAVEYDTVLDPANTFASNFEGVGPRAIPSTILIDTEGRVAVTLFGRTDARELNALVDAVRAHEA